MTTKVPNTKSLISQKLLDIIVCFNMYCKALSNMLLFTINRPQDNKIPWRLL